LLLKLRLPEKKDKLKDTMKLGYTILYVESVTATIAFYEKAFGLERGMVTETNQYGELQTGDTKLGFAANSFVKSLTGVPFETAGPGKPAPPLELGLVTDSVDAAFERAVAAGAVAVKRPEKKPWGQLVGYVRDNNGFLVELCSPITR
jgi:lactoylglutathione lyase